jgi:hypothetical protein
MSVLSKLGALLLLLLLVAGCLFPPVTYLKKYEVSDGVAGVWRTNTLRPIWSLEPQNQDLVPDSFRVRLDFLGVILIALAAGFGLSVIENRQKRTRRTKENVRLAVTLGALLVVMVWLLPPIGFREFWFPVGESSAMRPLYEWRPVWDTDITVDYIERKATGIRFDVVVWELLVIVAFTLGTVWRVARRPAEADPDAIGN